MIPIRSKLIFFFSIVILLLSMLAIVIMQNNNRSIEQYNTLLNRFFLLNEISLKTTKVNLAIQGYVIDSSPEKEMLLHYEQQADELKLYQSQLIGNLENESNYLLVKNYYHLIESYLEQGEATVRSVQVKEQSNYYDNLSQGNKIAKFIQDSTLNLINSELSNYHVFYLNIQNKNEQYQHMGIYAVISAMILCLIFSFWFSDGITRPIQMLSSAARQISRGHFEFDDLKVKTRDEMQFLTDTFNNMCSNIRFYIKEMKEKSELDTLLKKMELRSLQNQMNPHFLFNMLNMVTKMAYVEGAEKTSELIQSISTLLRYNLKKMNHIVPLRDEINIVKEYFFIQKMRFGNRIQFIEQIDEQLLESLVPSLTIQPLVENAFIHGVESLESGAELSIIVYEENNQVIVEISDNGVGISSEKMKSLFEEDTTQNSDYDHSTDHIENVTDSNGIGMKNVLRRLQLYYQCEEVMEVKSEVGKGTMIRLLIPN